jgi:hypothetical protein
LECRKSSKSTISMEMSRITIYLKLAKMSSKEMETMKILIQTLDIYTWVEELRYSNNTSNRNKL